jgi:AmiR/NasT family two-component response regulator
MLSGVRGSPSDRCERDRRNEDRKVIEKAKGILMKKARLDEQDAFRRLQKLASERNTKLVEIARTIVTAEEALKI